MRVHVERVGLVLLTVCVLSTAGCAGRRYTVRPGGPSHDRGAVVKGKQGTKVKKDKKQKQGKKAKGKKARRRGDS